jgi:hypothetical protein
LDLFRYRLARFHGGRPGEVVFQTHSNSLPYQSLIQVRHAIYADFGNSRVHRESRDSRSAVSPSQ